MGMARTKQTARKPRQHGRRFPLKGMRKEDFYFLFKKAIKSEIEVIVNEINEEESNQKVKKETKRTMIEAEKEAEKKYEEETEKKGQEESESEDEEQLDDTVEHKNGDADNEGV